MPVKKMIIYIGCKTDYKETHLAVGREGLGGGEAARAVETEAVVPRHVPASNNH